MVSLEASGARLLQASDAGAASDSDSGAELLERTPSRGQLDRGLAIVSTSRRLKAVSLAALAAVACVGAGSIWRGPELGSSKSTSHLGSRLELTSAPDSARVLRDLKVCHDNEERW